jgi:hypothetical protein
MKITLAASAVIAGLILPPAQARAETVLKFIADCDNNKQAVCGMVISGAWSYHIGEQYDLGRTNLSSAELCFDSLTATQRYSAVRRLVLEAVREVPSAGNATTAQSLFILLSAPANAELLCQLGKAY